MIDIDELERLAKDAGGMPWSEDGYIIFEDTPGSSEVVGRVSVANALCGEVADFMAAANPAAILALVAEVRALREDKARLDYLDGMNAALNAHYGTTYQWRVILSHNITRLTAGRQWAGYVGDVDLNDAQSGDGSFDSCRKAIDAAREGRAA